MNKQLPKISVVTSTYNQAQYLEDCITSVLNQNYPCTEYIVIDGGSTDHTLDVIRKYKDRLSYWISEPDGGQYDGLNKGFAKTTGEIMAWLNSDDKFTPWAFSVVADVFSCFPEVEWITSINPIFWNAKGQAIRWHSIEGFSRKSFFKGANLPVGRWYARCWIQQESTFWRRSLWERAGGHVDSAFSFAADFELWSRFYQHSELYGVAALLGGFRMHATQKTAHHMDKYIAEAEKIFRLHGGKPYSALETVFRRRIAPRVRPLLRVLQLITPGEILTPVKVIRYSRRKGGWVVMKELVI